MLSCGLAVNGDDEGQLGKEQCFDVEARCLRWAIQILNETVCSLVLHVNFIANH